MSEPIPAATSRVADTPIRTQADLERFWSRTLGGFDPVRDATWLLLIGDDDRPLPHLTEIDERDGPPTAEHLDSLARMLRLVSGYGRPGRRWAFLRCRIGPGAAAEADRVWGRDLVAACRRHSVPVEVPHLLTHAGLQPLPYDELAASA